MDIINDKAALLGAAKRKQEVVEVEPGKGVIVTEVSAEAYYQLLADKRFQFEEDGKTKVDILKMSPFIAAASLANADGTCADVSVDEFKKLGRKQQDDIIAAAFRVNGLSGDNEKNSAASQESDSPSGSPST